LNLPGYSQRGLTLIVLVVSLHTTVPDDMTHALNPAFALPTTGYIRQSQLIGVAEVTPEEAAHNRNRGKGPRRPRKGAAGVVPWSSATLWRKIGKHEFPAPVKLSERITAWKVETVLAWFAEHSSPPSAVVPAAPVVPDVVKPVAPPPKRPRGRPRKPHPDEARSPAIAA